MSKSRKTLKCKHMMYTQDMLHLPAKNLEEMLDIVNKIGADKYAGIIHDKDIDDKGNPVSPHVHIMMSFTNARSVNNIAKLINDKPQYIESWHGYSSNGYAYLVHATTTAKAKGKYQYSPTEVIANFDYLSELVKYQHTDKGSEQKNINTMLDLLGDGTITKKELLSMLSGSVYGKYKQQINGAHELFLKKNQDKWRKKMIDEGKRNHTIWIYGRSGTGKSYLAKDYASRRGEDFFVTGSSRDIFQQYEGQHTMIMDELRPNVLEYNDLLRLTDPYGFEAMAPSRYTDKMLACDLIIITTPFDPLEFYRL